MEEEAKQRVVEAKRAEAEKTKRAEAVEAERVEAERFANVPPMSINVQCNGKPPTQLSVKPHKTREGRCLAPISIATSRQLMPPKNFAVPEPRILHNLLSKSCAKELLAGRFDTSGVSCGTSERVSTL